MMESDLFDVNLFKQFIISKEPTKEETVADNSKFKCDICGVSLARISSLKRHKEAKHENIKYNCNHCNSEFSLPENLRKHKIKSHGYVDMREKFSCSFASCDYQASQKSSLTRHKQLIHNETYNCTDCGKQFQQNIQLIQHKKIHINQNRNNCSVCDKKFSHMGNLEKHMETAHTKSSKKFNCESCEFVATGKFQEEKLKSHRKRVHKEYFDTNEASV